jgi:uncharacterized OB-fold protein
MPVGPVIRDAETAAFLEGTAGGRFLLPRCPEGHASSPHAHACDTCGALDLTLEPASGVATVVTWAVVPGRPTEAGTVSPTVLCIAQLAEGPWWWSQLTDADPDQITVGTPLRIAFHRPSHAHEAIPVFTLADVKSGAPGSDQ